VRLLKKMQNTFLKYLESLCKNLGRKEIFDLVIYGSSVKGKEKPQDLDLVLIFYDSPLSFRLDYAQKLKNEIKINKEVDLKTMNLREFFDAGFLARQGIILEGYAVIHKKSLAELFGFSGWALFSYTLKNLNHNEKTKFTYVLIGRNKEGMLKKVHGKSIGRGAVLIPIKDSLFFEDFLIKWNVKYSKKGALIEL
jgi:predicted nucleotidyltransferase